MTEKSTKLAPLRVSENRVIPAFLAGLCLLIGMGCSEEEPPPVSVLSSSSSGGDDTPASTGSDISNPRVSGGGTDASAGVEISGGGTGTSGGVAASGGTEGSLIDLGQAHCTAPLPNGFCFISSNGDHIGRGETKLIGADGTFTLTGDAGDIRVEAIPAGEGLTWWMRFFAPDGDRLLPGRHYLMAQSFKFLEPGRPGLESASSAHSCHSHRSGKFFVSEAEYDQHGRVIRFSATFTHHCGEDAPPLHATVNFNANGESDETPTDLYECEVPLPTGLCVHSDRGVPIGDGVSASVSPDDADFHWFRSPGIVSIAVFAPKQLAVRFVAPAGEQLQVGTYDFSSENEAGPRIEGDSLGREGCEAFGGSFELLEYSFDVDTDEIQQLAIDFEYLCNDDLHAAAVGKVRYASDLP